MSLLTQHEALVKGQGTEGAFLAKSRIGSAHPFRPLLSVLVGSGCH